MLPKLKYRLGRIKLRNVLQDLPYLTLGGIIMAFTLDVFLAPADIAPGGVSGIAIIVNEFTGWPIGFFMFLLNLPLLVLGFRHLGKLQFLSRTLYVLIIYNLGADILLRWLPPSGLTDDLLLNALYSGVLGGLGTGLIYRGKGSAAGTGIVSRILQKKTGVPISQLYILTDGLVVIAAALTFGWEKALYATLSIFIWGLSTDFVLEGPSVIRTVFIVTDFPDQVSNAVLDSLHLGLTAWQGKGMFSGDAHTVLFCTVSRPDVNALRSVIMAVDPHAFVVIGQAHQASGGVTLPAERKPAAGRQKNKRGQK